MERHERFFGFVAAVSPDLNTLMEGLARKSYDTLTSGHRTMAPARAAAEGAPSTHLPLETHPDQ